MNKIQSLQQYIEAAKDLLGNDWYPNENQWKKIMAKINDACKEVEETADIEGRLTYLEEMVEYLDNKEPVSRPQERFAAPGPFVTSSPSRPTDSHFQQDTLDTVELDNSPSGPSLLPSRQPQNGSEINIPSSDDNVKHTGERIKTPSIDTSSGNYSSPLE